MFCTHPSFNMWGVLSCITFELRTHCTAFPASFNSFTYATERLGITHTCPHEDSLHDCQTNYRQPNTSSLMQTLARQTVSRVNKHASWFGIQFRLSRVLAQKMIVFDWLGRKSALFPSHTKRLKDISPQLVRTGDDWQQFLQSLP